MYLLLKSKNYSFVNITHSRMNFCNVLNYMSNVILVMTTLFLRTGIIFLCCDSCYILVFSSQVLTGNPYDLPNSSSSDSSQASLPQFLPTMPMESTGHMTCQTVSDVPSRSRRPLVPTRHHSLTIPDMGPFRCVQMSTNDGTASGSPLADNQANLQAAQQQGVQPQNRNRSLTQNLNQSVQQNVTQNLQQTVGQNLNQNLNQNLSSVQQLQTVIVPAANQAHNSILGAIQNVSQPKSLSRALSQNITQSLTPTVVRSTPSNVPISGALTIGGSTVGVVSVQSTAPNNVTISQMSQNAPTTLSSDPQTGLTRAILQPTGLPPTGLNTGITTSGLATTGLTAAGLRTVSSDPYLIALSDQMTTSDNPMISVNSRDLNSPVFMDIHQQGVCVEELHQETIAMETGEIKLIIA